MEEEESKFMWQEHLSAESSLVTWWGGENETAKYNKIC